MIKEKNKKSKGKFGILVILAILVIATTVTVIGINVAGGAVDPSNDEKISLSVSEGETTSEIADDLASKDLIKSAFVFGVKAKISGNDGKFQQGVYSIQKSMTMNEIIEKIASGDTDLISFTIPEGYTTKQTMDRLVNAGLVTEDEFMDEVNNGNFDYEFLEDAPQNDSRLEGYLYPNTYFIYDNASSHDIIDKMLSAFASLVTDEHYAKAEELGMSMRDIVTIASLIEEETKVADERSKVASVIYNRLDINMKLQIDATVQYALPEPKESLLYSDLEIDSPYNTYLHYGIPYGPICSPRIESIDAALEPADTDYIYYVLAPELDGRHNFSATANEFEENKEAYKEAIAARNTEEDQ